MHKRGSTGKGSEAKRKFVEAILKGDMKVFENMLTGVTESGQPMVKAGGSDDSGTPFLQVT